MRAADPARPCAPAPESTALVDARRAMQVCNACRYCEGYCAVFPAMELRREFTVGDLSYLANLCHNCRGCYYACQYAPPHEFGINLPRTFGQVRLESYAAYAWPGFLARLFHRNGLVVSLAGAGAVALVLILTVALRQPDLLLASNPDPGAFYRVIPAPLMIGVASATVGFSLIAFTVGAVTFWRRTGAASLPRPRPLLRALGDVLTLRYLGGGDDAAAGCNDLGEGFSRTRRRYHHALFYGFFLCFASTTVAAFYEHVLGRLAPYPLLSLPVVLGTAGGIGMLIGCGGLLWMKIVGDPAPSGPEIRGPDFALLALLWSIAATGLLLLVLRATGAMGILLAVHLGFVLAFFLVMPYSKFVHGLYRGLALVRHAMEAGGNPGPRG